MLPWPSLKPRNPRLVTIKRLAATHDPRLQIWWEHFSEQLDWQLSRRYNPATESLRVCAKMQSYDASPVICAPMAYKVTAKETTVPRPVINECGFTFERGL